MRGNVTGDVAGAGNENITGADLIAAVVDQIDSGALGHIMQNSALNMMPGCDLVRLACMDAAYPGIDVVQGQIVQ